MAQTVWPLVQRRFGDTSRRDAWWIQPVLVFLGLSTFIVYATWAAFQGTHFEYGPYLSPFYSPLLFGDSAHAWFGPIPTWWPSALPFSAALLILWAPGGFRVTCYYYRGAYYKAFWADPPGAPSANRARAIGASARFRSCSRTCTDTSCTSASSSSPSSWSMRTSRTGSSTPRVRRILVSVWAAYC